MRTIPTLLAVALAAAACCAQPAAETGQPPVEYAHAGVALSLPSGFRQEPVTGPYDVLEASLPGEGDDGPLVGVSLAAYPLDDEDTAASLAERMSVEAARALQVRDFRVLSQTDLPVARSQGTATMSYYEYRCEPTVAARAYLTRDVGEDGPRIGYVLTVESAPKEKDRMLAVFGHVVESVRLLPVRRPVEIKPGELAAPVVREDLGISLRPLHGWYATETPAGVETGQMDYRTGQVMPIARLIASDSPADADAEACARIDLQRAARQGEDRGVVTETVSQGPADLGGRSGYQFVMRKRPGEEAGDEELSADEDAAAQPPAEPDDAGEDGEAPQTAPAADAEPAPATVIAQRIACVPGAAGASGRRYTLILIGQAEDPGPLVAILDRLAGGVEILTPTTQPAAPAGPATRPAQPDAEQPATQPAAASRPSEAP